MDDESDNLVYGNINLIYKEVLQAVLVRQMMYLMDQYEIHLGERVNFGTKFNQTCEKILKKSVVKNFKTPARPFTFERTAAETAKKEREEHARKQQHEMIATALDRQLFPPVTEVPRPVSPNPKFARDPNNDTQSPSLEDDAVNDSGGTTPISKETPTRQSKRLSVNKGNKGEPFAKKPRFGEMLNKLANEIESNEPSDTAEEVLGEKANHFVKALGLSANATPAAIGTDASGSKVFTFMNVPTTFAEDQEQPQNKTEALHELMEKEKKGKQKLSYRNKNINKRLKTYIATKEREKVREKMRIAKDWVTQVVSKEVKDGVEYRKLVVVPKYQAIDKVQENVNAEPGENPATIGELNKTNQSNKDTSANNTKGPQKTICNQTNLKSTYKSILNPLSLLSGHSTPTESNKVTKNNVPVLENQNSKQVHSNSTKTVLAQKDCAQDLIPEGSKPSRSDVVKDVENVKEVNVQVEAIDEDFIDIENIDDDDVDKTDKKEEETIIVKKSKNKPMIKSKKAVSKINSSNVEPNIEYVDASTEPMDEIPETDGTNMTTNESVAQNPIQMPTNEKQLDPDKTEDIPNTSTPVPDTLQVTDSTSAENKAIHVETNENKFNENPKKKATVINDNQNKDISNTTIEGTNTNQVASKTMPTTIEVKSKPTTNKTAQTKKTVVTNNLPLRRSKREIIAAKKYAESEFMNSKKKEQTPQITIPEDSGHHATVTVEYELNKENTAMSNTTESLIKDTNIQYQGTANGTTAEKPDADGVTNKLADSAQDKEQDAKEHDCTDMQAMFDKVNELIQSGDYNESVEIHIEGGEDTEAVKTELAKFIAQKSGNLGSSNLMVTSADKRLSSDSDAKKLLTINEQDIQTTETSQTDTYSTQTVFNPLDTTNLMGFEVLQYTETVRKASAQGTVSNTDNIDMNDEIADKKNGADLLYAYPILNKDLNAELENNGAEHDCGLDDMEDGLKTLGKQLEGTLVDMPKETAVTFTVPDYKSVKKLKKPLIFYHCDQCDKKYSSESDCEYHKKFHHFETFTAQDGKLRYQCRDCEKSYRTHEAARYHKTHVHGEIYHCNVCGSEFTRQRTYEAHMKIHKDHPECKQQLVFQCHVCGETIASKKMFSKHMYMKHLYVMCEICKEPVKKAALKAHVMVKHEKPDKRFFCEICGKGFVRKDKLTAHMYTHQDKQFGCVHCGKFFARPDKLKTHVKTFHSYSLG